MDRRYERNARIGIYGGYSFLLLAVAIGFYLQYLGVSKDVMAAATMTIFLSMLLWGFGNLAVGKGYHWALTLLIFTGLIGMAVIILLPIAKPKTQVASSAAEEGEGQASE